MLPGPGNNAVVKWKCRCEIVILLPFDKYPKGELLDLMIVLFLMFLGTSILFFHSGCT